jgi:hypothetical protein
MRYTKKIYKQTKTKPKILKGGVRGSKRRRTKKKESQTVTSTQILDKYIKGYLNKVHKPKKITRRMATHANKQLHRERKKFLLPLLQQYKTEYTPQPIEQKDIDEADKELNEERINDMDYNIEGIIEIISPPSEILKDIGVSLMNAEEVPSCHSHVPIDEQMRQIDNTLGSAITTYHSLLERLSTEEVGKSVTLYGAENALSTLKKGVIVPEDWRRRNPAITAWYDDVIERHKGGFQRLQESDIGNAFYLLLPFIDPSEKLRIMKDLPFTRIKLILQEYLYKVATSLFTKANVTYAVLHYNEYVSAPPPTPTPTHQNKYEYLINLMNLMSDASISINTILKDKWDEFVQVPISGSCYVHSGGNLFLLIAGTLCYLHESQHLPDSVSNILENIRQEFHAKIGGEKGEFYIWLNSLFKEKEFCENVKKITGQISDLDFLFLTLEDRFVSGLTTPDGKIANPITKRISDTSAYILRKICTDAHKLVPSPESVRSKKLLPFAKNPTFNDWNIFKMTDFTSISQDIKDQMKRITDDLEIEYTTERERTTGTKLKAKDKIKFSTIFKGYRQSLSFIPKLPIYLNRIKQGYPFYPSLHEATMNTEVSTKEEIFEFAGKYGECLDLSIGDISNKTFNHKQENYKKKNYYSIENLVFELEGILAKAADDKSEKRQCRFDFMTKIIKESKSWSDDLFQTIGFNIQYI